MEATTPMDLAQRLFLAIRKTADLAQHDSNLQSEANQAQVLELEGILEELMYPAGDAVQQDVTISLDISPVKVYDQLLGGGPRAEKSPRLPDAEVTRIIEAVCGPTWDMEEAQRDQELMEIGRLWGWVDDMPPCWLRLGGTEGARMAEDAHGLGLLIMETDEEGPVYCPAESPSRQDRTRLIPQEVKVRASDPDWLMVEEALDWVDTLREGIWFHLRLTEGKVAEAAWSLGLVIRSVDPEYPTDPSRWAYLYQEPLGTASFVDAPIIEVAQ